MPKLVWIKWHCTESNSHFSYLEPFVFTKLQVNMSKIQSFILKNEKVLKNLKILSKIQSFTLIYEKSGHKIEIFIKDSIFHSYIWKRVVKNLKPLEK